MRHETVIIVSIFGVELCHLPFHLFAIIRVIKRRAIMEVDTIKRVEFHHIKVIFQPCPGTFKYTLNQVRCGDN